MCLRAADESAIHSASPTNTSTCFCRSLSLSMEPPIELVFLLSTLLAVSNNQVVRCPSGQFPCGNMSVCIPQSFHCNGHVDCPNEADERNCDDRDPSFRYFSGSASNLTEDDLPFCFIPEYPPDCYCEASTWINCRSLGLKSVPVNITPNITILILVNNSISTIRPGEIGRYSQLDHLQLGNNFLERIESGTFAGLGELTTLSLSFNRIRFLDRHAFYGLDNLTILRIGNNLIGNLNPEVLEDLPRIVFLDMTYNFITIDGGQFPNLKHLTWLYLQDNHITEVHRKTFASLNSLRVLNLSKNRITYIEEGAFIDLSKLIELNLSFNQITSLHPRTFVGLSILDKLNLAFNPLTVIEDGLFNPMQHSLQSLCLEGIEISNINLSLFSSLQNLSFVYMKKFNYCSYLPHVRVCFPNTDGVSSLDNLLGNPILRIFLWFIGFSTCIGNVMVLFGRTVTREDNKIVSLFIRNLAAADLLMGIYLFIIGVNDWIYRDQYYRYARVWLSSWQCTISGTIAMTSSEASVIILTYMSLERFIFIGSPFGGQGLSKRTAVSSLAAIWTTGLALAFIPIMQWQQEHSNPFYGSNGMCFPLHIDDPFILGWEYSAFIFFGINGLGVMVIFIAYLALFFSIKKTRCNTSLPIKDIEFATRFVFIVITDMLCWIPIIILKIVALYTETVSADLYAWFVIFVLPINSAINPLLYTFSIRNFRDQLKKVFSFHPMMQWIGHRKDSGSLTPILPPPLQSVVCIMAKPEV